MGADEERDRKDRDDRVLTELGKIYESWQLYRQSFNHAITYLSEEVARFKQDIKNIEDERKEQRKKDDIERAAQRAALDTKLSSIERGLESMRTWQYIRVGIEVAAILIVVALLIGKLWL